MRHLTVQFSVFSHLFVEAQLRKVINAADLDTYRAGKEILLNELGVVFNAGRAPPAAAGTDPELVATEGTVDGGRFRFGAAHFEWLLRFAAPLGLGFDDLGKRRHGTAAHAVLLRRAARGLRLRGRVDRRGRQLRGGALGGRRVLEGAHRRPRGVQGARVRRTCRSPSGPGTTRSRTSTPPTPTTSWSRRSRSRGSTRSASSPAPPAMLDGVQAFWDGLWADHEAGVER